MTEALFAVLFAFLYSAANTIVGPMMATQKIEFDPSCVGPFLVCFVLCGALIFSFLYFVPRFMSWLEMRKIVMRITGFLEKIGDRRLFLLIWAFIFISWIPAFLVLYPGVLSYDMVSQVESALNGIDNNHHPILHTWLIGFFMTMGHNVFSSYEVGLGFLSLLQMILLSYALTRVVFLMKKRKVPVLLIILTALFSGGWFMDQCMSVTMVKDSLFSVFFVLFACHFTEMTTGLSEYVSRKRNLVFLPIVSFLMCALRNNGIEIYIFCFAILFILKIRRIKKLKTYAALVAVIIITPFMYKIYTGPVFDALGIAAGPVREALSVPIQQLKRVAVIRGNELNDEQNRNMSYYFDNTGWRQNEYNPFIADPAKSCFYSSHYDEDPIAFWKFYLQIGKQFSKECVNAFLSNTLGFWYPGYYGFSYVMYENYPPEMFTVPLERKSICNSQVLKKYYEDVCGSDFWRSTPVLRVFFVSGFSLWFLLLALAAAFIWQKGIFLEKALPVFLPMIAQYGIMILSPMSSFRYSWPLYMILPLSFIALFGEWKKTDNAGVFCKKGGL